MNDTPVLHIENVSKRIRHNQILSSVSLTVKSGEILGLLGPNGSGKTTLIRSVLGLVSINTGVISIGGYSVKRNFEKAVSHAGAIVENPEFYNYMSGYYNLVHFANMSDPIGRGRIAEVFDLVGLGERIHDPVRTYSLGMRQRLGIAQAVLHKPQLLLLDEPTNGLDPSGIRELREYLKNLRDKENVGIVISTHLLKEVEDMCDRVAIIKKGRILSVQPVHHEADDLPIRVLFETNQPLEAEEAVKIYSPQPVPGGLEFLVNREDIPHINRKLTENGIDVFAIYPKRKNLEESFLELTEEAPE
ncbi:ABC transporter ATP-binding protein [Bacillus sp. FJAT-42376]|uniref:ABC transporter ATP-binding protein n=1 Tax=Bacillus sp. FJAT-42376 TaxID=2014076 RepID=UPI000F5134C8|nr:ABC transporter ATP-binding protein [Bacillus sp. FJAT-42376]AZB41050.1 ABC transporter ATP-binding protein [Bacillus sp. FJAT-42376]